MSFNASFRGLWTRSIIAWPNGQSDVTTQVNWLQGISLFCDLRQPAGLAQRVSASTCRADLTQEDCFALASQQGFSGHFEPNEAAYEWVRCIDYQPPSAMRDIGRLSWRDDIMVEEGVEANYVEHWHRESIVSDTDCAGLWLYDARSEVFGCLVRVSRRFGYARGRAKPLGKTSLADLVAESQSLQQMQELVDCEISLGEVSENGWRITRSSLPYKVGAALKVQLGQQLQVADIDESGDKKTRQWNILKVEGNLRLF